PRIITVPLACLQAIGYCAIYQKQGVLQNFSLIDPRYALQTWSILVTLTTGTMVLVWLGELITENGIGNGISLLIFAGILSRLPALVTSGYNTATSSGGAGGGLVS